MENFNITITERAASEIKIILAEESAAYLRAYVMNANACSCGLKYGMAVETVLNDGDVLTQSMGVDVVIDPASLETLNGASIEYFDGGDLGGGFTITGPAVCQCASAVPEGNCGCGGGCGCG